MNPRLAPAVALFVGTVAVCAAAPSVVPTLSSESLRRGQKATVRTVFAGDSIETFDAEIVGVLKGGRADGDMILARATSERVVRTGVAQGMSGSPVYVDGRLIGALSTGWSFSREPIFGVTPIGEMLRVLEQPDDLDPGAIGPAGGDGDTKARFGAFRWSDADAEPVTHEARDVTRPQPLAVPLAASGLTSAIEPLLGDALRPLGFSLTPAGRRSDRGEPSSLVPGAACAVDLLRGDLNLSAIGTVTYRDGDRVLIFGHPFFGGGAIRLPLSTADIVGILPSMANSFKLGSPGRTVGTATQDRRTAVAGVLGASPHMLPVTVEVSERDGRAQVFHFESIEDRVLMPQLLAAAVGNSVAEAGGSNATQTVAWTLTLHRHGGRAVTLRDLQTSEAAATDAYSSLLSPIRFLANNPFERLRLDSVRVSVHTSPGRDQWTLRSTALGAPRVRAGQTLTVRCELEHWRGERRPIELQLPIPEELPAGRYVLWLGGGAELARAEAAKLPARYRPTSLDDAFARLAASRPSDALYLALWARAPEVTSDGVDLPELPASALPLLDGPQSATDVVHRGDWALVDERRTVMRGVVRGDLTLELTVESRTP